MNRPLPCRNGIAASYIAMPAGKWETIVDFIQATLPEDRSPWLLKRINEGAVVDSLGHPIDAKTPYRPHHRIWFYRDLHQEPPVPDDIHIIYRDENIVAVDKPHFLSCVPAGRHIKETVLTRLRVLLERDDVAPVHRLDRETAGVVVFCLQQEKRGAYQILFENREVEKSYEAIAYEKVGVEFPLTYQSRLENVDGFITVHEVDGEPNSQTYVEKLASDGTYAHLKLKPHTGKKHQLRAHMSALGMPLVNDPWYPEILPDKGFDFTHPLQLLARELSFKDPFSGKTHLFVSQRNLAYFQS